MPPGIPLPFGLRLDGLDTPKPSDSVDLPLMPELGRLPSATAEGENAAGQDAPQDEKQSVFDVPESLGRAGPSVESKETISASDDRAFPALPKVRPSTASSTETPSPRPVFAKKSSAKIAEPQDSASSVDTHAKLAVPAVATKQPKDEEATTVEATAVEAKEGSPASSKRHHPGKLDISAATKVAETKLPAVQKEPSSSRAPSPTPSVKGTPTTGSPRVGTPSETTAKRTTAPRTLRVLPTPTPKAETPPSTVSTPAIPAVAKVAGKAGKHVSRQASVASATAPDTPSSERPDDTVSMTTESMTVSRAGTPPLGSRVGSAPVRAKTKSQQKKERQERARAEGISPDVEAPTPVDDVVQEPIIGRKKKAKKPTAAAPPPVQVKKEPAKKEPVKKEPAKEIKQKEPEPQPKPRPVEEKPAAEVKKTTQPQRSEQPAEKTVVDTPPAKAATSTPAPEPMPQPSVPVFSAKDIEAAKRTLLAEEKSLLESLETMLGGDMSPAMVNFFKHGASFPALGHDFSMSAVIDAIPHIDMTPTLTADEQAALAAGKPVRHNADGDPAKRDSLVNLANRHVVLPHTRHTVHSLPRELEERLLALDERVGRSRPPHKYTHRPTNANASAVAKLVSQMLADVSAGVSGQLQPQPQLQPQNQQRVPTPQPTPAQQMPNRQYTGAGSSSSRGGAAQANTPRTPSYADDALAYLNQFILPAAPPAPASTANSAAGAGSSGAPPPIASGIPRTYTTGSPTYSVAGVDVPGAQAHSHGHSSGSPAPSVPVPPTSTTSNTKTGAASSKQDPNAIDELIGALKKATQGDAAALTNAAALSRLLTPTLSRALANPADLLGMAGVGGSGNTSGANAGAGAAASTLAGVTQAIMAAAAGDASTSSSAQQQPPAWSPEDAAALSREILDMTAEAVGRATGSFSGGAAGASSGASPAGTSRVAQPNSLAEALSRVAAGAPLGFGSGGGSGKGGSGEEAARLLAEVEGALAAGRREVEALDRKMAGMQWRNRKMAGLHS